MELWKPHVLVLGPGGAKGYLELGLMLYFEQQNYLSQVHTFVGCSVGASIVLLSVCGYNATEIIEHCININIVNGLLDINFNKKPGLLTIKSIEDKLSNLIRDKFGYVPTLDQLYNETGVLLDMVSYNVDKDEAIYLSKNTEPELSCVEACMMSMAVPELIVPRIYKGNVYVDGAFGDPYPILPYDNGDNNVLGVYINSKHSCHASDESYLRLGYRCLQALFKTNRNLIIKVASNMCKHIGLETPVIDTTGMSLDKTEKVNMVNAGYREAEMFLKKLRDPIKFQILLNDNEEISLDDDDNNDEILDGDEDEYLSDED